jgi:O-antigen/teichoic acid export membrane protein
MSSRHEQGLVRHSLLLMAATQLANVSNLIFQVLMGWSLDRVEYGALATMLNITLIVATPLDALRTATAHFTARCARTGQPQAVWTLVRRWSIKVTAVALPVALAGMLASAPLARFFQMTDPWPVILTSLVLVGLVVLPLFIGALQGMQSFLWMSGSQYAWSLIRLFVGAALVWGVTRTAAAGLAAQAIGVFVAVCIGWVGLRRVVGPAGEGAEPSHGVGAYFVRSLWLLAGFAVLMNADMILVKHFFDPDQAGQFAQAATIGRSIIFLPMPIALAMFPKVISMGATSQSSRRTLVLALGMVVALIGAAALAVSLWPWLPLRVMYNVKAPTPEQLHLVRCVIWAMAPLGLVYLLMNFELAQHRFSAMPGLLILAWCYVTGVGFLHASLLQVVGVLALVSVLAAALFAVLFFSARSRAVTA